MRGATLTLRGGCFLASGVASGIAAFFFGQVDLLRVGLLLLGVPLAAILLLLRSKVRLTASRVVQPLRISVEESARVALRITNISRLPTGTLLLEDTLPLAVRARPRFVLDRLVGREHRDITYTVRPAARGRFRLGPLTLRLTDPLGLWEMVREFPTVEDLIVTPSVVTLPALPLLGWSDRGLRPSSMSTSDGEDDVGVREYRHGDALRRVHWRATAKYGEVMVRREETPERARALVLLDNRASMHAGTGRRSSFETAVSVAASLAVALMSRGYEVSVRTTTGEDADLRSAGPGADALLEAMATTRLQEGAVDADAVTAALGGTTPGGGRGRPDVVLAVMRQVDEGLAPLLAATAHRNAHCCAVLVAAEGGAAPALAGPWRSVAVPTLADLAPRWPELVTPTSRGPAWQAPSAAPSGYRGRTVEAPR